MQIIYHWSSEISRSSWLLENFTCVSIYLAYSAVNLLNLFGDVLFVVLQTLFFIPYVTNVRHYLDVFVAFLGLSFYRRIVQTHYHNRNVVSWTSHHRLKKQILRTLFIALLLFSTLVIYVFDDLNCLFILNSVPKTVTGHNNKIVIIYLETCDFRLANYDFWRWLFGLEIPKSSGRRQSAWKNSQGANNLIVVLSISLCNGRRLVNLSSCWNDSLLLLWIRRFMILCNLVEFFTVLTCQNCSWIS